MTMSRRTPLPSSFPLSLPLTSSLLTLASLPSRLTTRIAAAVAIAGLTATGGWVPSLALADAMPAADTDTADAMPAADTDTADAMPLADTDVGALHAAFLAERLESTNASESKDSELITFRREVTRLVNAERSKRGLGSMKLNSVLNASAQAHARDMARNDYFDHSSRDGRSPFDRILAAGYKGLHMGENIAAGRNSPRGVMADWMSSPGHRANILADDYNEIGVGYAADSSSNFGAYWVQNFGGTR